MDNDEFGYRAKSFFVVNALMLRKTLCNKSSFIMLDGTIGVIFNLEDPFATNGTMTRRKGNHGSCIVVLKGTKLCLHGFNLLRIMVSLLIRNWFDQVRYIMYKLLMSKRKIGVRNIPSEGVLSIGRGRRDDNRVKR